MKSITHISLATFAVGAAMVACIKSNPVDLPEPGIEQDVVRLTLDSPRLDDSSRASTRAMTTDVENEIETASVLVFDPVEGLTTTRGAELVSGTTFDVRLPRGTFDLMVVVNAAEVAGSLVPRSSKAEVIRQLTVSRAEKWDYADPIPMWGHADGAAIDETATLSVEVHRMLTRVDIRLADAVTNFELQQIWLANSNSVGLVAPNYLDPAVWDPDGGVVNPGKGVAIAPSLPADPEKQEGLAQLFTDADGVTARAAIRTIYTFEAANGSNLERVERPCLIIGGSYSGGNTSWYRVDFALPAGGGEFEYLPLLRNHNYVITINSVSGPGLASPEEALDSSESPITIGVQEWQDGNLGEIGL